MYFSKTISEVQQSRAGCTKISIVHGANTPQAYSSPICERWKAPVRPGRYAGARSRAETQRWRHRSALCHPARVKRFQLLSTLKQWLHKCKQLSKKRSSRTPNNTRGRANISRVKLNRILRLPWESTEVSVRTENGLCLAVGRQNVSWVSAHPRRNVLTEAHHFNKKRRAVVLAGNALNLKIRVV